MARRVLYDVEAEWDDPFEHMKDRRRAERFETGIKVSIAVPNGRHHGYMVGPGVLKDVSLGGIRLMTKHKLKPDQDVIISIPTDACDDELCLPKTFGGTARVVRVMPQDEKRSEVALHFQEGFMENIEFAVFIDSLKALSRVIARPK